MEASKSSCLSFQ